MAELFPNADGMMMGGGGPADQQQQQQDDGKMIDLTRGDSKIDMVETYGKNIASNYPISNLFIGDTTLGCKSDSDEQLIIHISFQEFVKIKSIKLTEYNNGLDPELNPTKVHLYVNRENLGFEDIDDIDPTQTIELNEQQLKESSEPILLKFVKYQRVKSLTLYIDENAGGPITAIGSLKLYGKPVATVNMNNFKAQREH